MKVCFLTTAFPRDKNDYAGVFIYRLAQHLKCGVKVVAPNDTSSTEYEIADRIEVYRFNYFFKRLQTLAYGQGGIPVNLRRNKALYLLLPSFFLSFLWRAVSIAKTCDVVHAHWIASGAVGVILKAFLDKPLIITLRGTDFQLMEGTGFSKRLFLFILRRADIVSTVNERMKEKLSQEGPLKGKVVFIPNGVYIKENSYFPEAQKLIGNRKCIMFIGSLTRNKGVKFLLEAVPMIVREEPHSMFIIIGDGEERDALAQKVKHLGIGSSVEFLGAKPPDEIPCWLSHAHIFVLPSLSEGRPNVVLEAMAAGVPIVASDIDGIRELVRDGEGGFLAVPADPASFSEKILHLLRDEDLRKKMGLSATKYIEKKGLTWDRCADKFIECYGKMLEATKCVESAE